MRQDETAVGTLRAHRARAARRRKRLGLEHTLCFIETLEIIARDFAARKLVLQQPGRMDGLTARRRENLRGSIATLHGCLRQARERATRISRELRCRERFDSGKNHV